uniref:Uncharacterized protein n=1 Tax=Helicotheca tamesis TaxID=374047 RepID=A0A7S2H154_9STRA|mmetsp:Transcript_14241/g.19477  ORF Transcript_14241/g.19477 Transcript_14241/m.19477 type:complete len:314 (+) Transcript_14241:76-1017(+)
MSVAMVGDITASVLSICGVVYVTHMIHRLFSAFHPAPPRTLYLRKLKQSGAEMLTGAETDNIFTDELNLLADLIFAKIDLCVMKHLKNIPILSKQEQLHAKMHHEGQAERKRLQQGLNRWSRFRLVDFFLLRAGKEIGCTCAGFAEANTSIMWHVPMALPFVKGYQNNELVYHGMEEIEHGPLTTQYLRTQIGVLSPLFLFPLAVIFFFIFYFSPPIVLLVAHPAKMMKPKTYTDLLLYYCTFVPTFFAVLFGCLLHWVLPFRESEQKRKEKYIFFSDLVEKRGIKFDVIENETYIMEGMEVKVVPEIKDTAK